MVLARVRGTWTVGACVGVVLESMSFAVSDAEQAGGLAGVRQCMGWPILCLEHGGRNIWRMLRQEAKMLRRGFRQTISVEPPRRARMCRSALGDP